MKTPPILILAAALLGVAQAAPSAKPNIIYILADDMGPGDVRAYNKDGKIATPNIDRMAKEGMMFMDGHTNSSVCTPTRYGIMTGRYAWRTSMKEGVLGGHSPHLIEPQRETAASLLKKNGYATACFGKWHLGMDWTLTDGTSGRRVSWKNVDPAAPIGTGPLDVGFDHYFGISASLNMSPHAYIEDRKLLGTLESVNDIKGLNERGLIQPAQPGYVAKEFVQQEVLSTLTDRTCKWIREHSDKPFFVYFPLPSPHSPIVPSERFKNKSGLNDHGDFCMETDWVVGEILATLDDLKIADSTIVIFTADNGTSPHANFKLLAEKGHHPSWIYRGLKGTNWEGGHRVPFVVRWPDAVKAGSVSKQVICTTDLISTCSELIGSKLPDAVGEDSVSFLPALKGETIAGTETRIVVHHSDKGSFAVRRGKWKLVFDAFGASNRGDPRKDEPITDSDKMMLFDMESDAVENINLAKSHPEVVESLKKGLAEIIRNGRSTPGENQTTDLDDPGTKWPQIDIIRDYLKS